MWNQSKPLEIDSTPTRGPSVAGCWPRHMVRLGAKQFRQTRCSPPVSMLLIIDALPRRAALIGPSFCNLSPRSDVLLWRHKYWDMALSVLPSLRVSEITCRVTNIQNLGIHSIFMATYRNKDHWQRLHIFTWILKRTRRSSVTETTCLLWADSIHIPLPHFHLYKQRDTQCTYKVTLKHFRVTIVAVETVQWGISGAYVRVVLYRSLTVYCKKYITSASVLVCTSQKPKRVCLLLCYKHTQSKNLFFKYPQTLSTRKKPGSTFWLIAITS